MKHTPAVFRGFTLIELLIVISIIGMLAGIGIAFAPQALNKAKITRAAHEVSNLEMAVTRYKGDYGIYPDDATPKAVANALTGYKNSPDQMEDYSKDPDWKGPYLPTKPHNHENSLKNMAIVDPWKRNYQFLLRNPVHNKAGVDIWSYGPNGKDDKGTGDDICNWK